MKFIKKFEKFLENAEPSVKPKSPTTKPGTKPGTRPNRPSPIRRDSPAPGTEPAPKATAKDVVDRFIKLSKEEDMDLKKILK